MQPATRECGLDSVQVWYIDYGQVMDAFNFWLYLVCQCTYAENSAFLEKQEEVGTARRQGSGSKAGEEAE